MKGKQCMKDGGGKPLDGLSGTVRFTLKLFDKRPAYYLIDASAAIHHYSSGGLGMFQQLVILLL